MDTDQMGGSERGNEGTKGPEKGRASAFVTKGGDSESKAEESGNQNDPREIRRGLGFTQAAKAGKEEEQTGDEEQAADELALLARTRFRKGKQEQEYQQPPHGMKHQPMGYFAPLQRLAAIGKTGLLRVESRVDEI